MQHSCFISMFQTPPPPCLSTSPTLPPPPCCLTARPTPLACVEPRSYPPPPWEAGAGHLEAAHHLFFYLSHRSATSFSFSSAQRHRPRELIRAICPPHRIIAQFNAPPRSPLLHALIELYQSHPTSLERAACHLLLSRCSQCRRERPPMARQPWPLSALCSSHFMFLVSP
jgi:hypothetical protein